MQLVFLLQDLKILFLINYSLICRFAATLRLKIIPYFHCLFLCVPNTALSSTGFSLNQRKDSVSLFVPCSSVPVKATANLLPPPGFSAGSCNKHQVHTRAVPVTCIQSIFRILLIATQIKQLHSGVYLVMEKWGQFHFQITKGLKTSFYTKKVTRYFRLY